MIFIYGELPCPVKASGQDRSESLIDYFAAELKRVGVACHHFMAQLCEAEIQSRLHNRTEIYLKPSKLGYDAVLEQGHCTSGRNLSREPVATTSDCGFVKRAENILITGATGCAKSYLACAIGRQACAFGYKYLKIDMGKSR